ncbi:hypothetical protein [Ferroglobus placidus]|uniref:hypothetical protein n=1 Tax=Ferroglobus placidus TaxID=54261 RepID=UPI0011D162D5|nr:hypothetical protein [Ferroglobus placidus]
MVELRILFLAVAALFCLLTPVQAEWAKIYGGEGNETAYAIQRTDDGYVVAGWTDSLGDTDIWIVKLDGEGNVVWEKSYGSPLDDYAYSIQKVSDGYVIAGKAGSKSYSGSRTQFDIFYGLVMKVDEYGNVLWAKKYDKNVDDEPIQENAFHSIRQTSDGGYVVAGYTTIPSDPLREIEYNIWILKLDANGNVMWEKVLDMYNRDKAYSIQQTGDGGYIVAGVAADYNVISFPNPYRSNLWMVKLNSSGFVEWEGIYDWKVVDEFSSLQQADDGYVVAGTSRSAGVLSPNVYESWILKIDNSGHIRWQRTYNESTYEKISSIQKVNDGYVVAGSAAGDVWIFKIDGSGLIQWQKRYGGDKSDWAADVKKADDGYVVASNTRSFSSDSDFWILKLNDYGSVTGLCLYEIVANAQIGEAGFDEYVFAPAPLLQPAGINVNSLDLQTSGISPISNAICPLQAGGTPTPIQTPTLTPLPDQTSIPEFSGVWMGIAVVITALVAGRMMR